MKQYLLKFKNKLRKSDKDILQNKKFKGLLLKSINSKLHLKYNINSICKINLLFSIINLLKDQFNQDNYLEDMFKVIRVCNLPKNNKLYLEEDTNTDKPNNIHLKWKCYHQEMPNNQAFQALLKDLSAINSLQEVFKRSMSLQEILHQDNFLQK